MLPSVAFIKAKEILIPKIQHRVKIGDASEDEKKILYGFLLDKETILLKYRVIKKHPNGIKKHNQFCAVKIEIANKKPNILAAAFPPLKLAKIG